LCWKCELLSVSFSEGNNTVAANNASVRVDFKKEADKNIKT
jgi:hypothetical protein